MGLSSPAHDPKRYYTKQEDKGEKSESEWTCSCYGQKVELLSGCSVRLCYDACGVSQKRLAFSSSSFLD